MKNKFTTLMLFSAIILLFTINCHPIYAQNNKALKDSLSKLDTSAFKGKAFLNKAFFYKSLIDPLQKKDKDKEGNPILTLTPQHFNMLTTIIEEADLNDKPKPKSIIDIQARTINQITSNNTIPIGIINADALFLTEQQLAENKSAKKNKKAVDNKSYENIEVIVAGLMQGEVYQGNVFFQISPKLIQENINNPIKGIDIDFQDGKGYLSFDFKEQLIPYQFKTIGEVAISIKLITKRGTYLTYNILKVNQLERPIPYGDKNVVTATKIIKKSDKNAKIADNVVGAEYAIYTGCDGVFDKPIIIAEGFDINQNVNIDVLVSKYYPYLYAFRNHGYDLVFVNYNDGQDYIENNAQVLKRVIREVNSRKIGNNKLTVIGESMSGLVARWALKEMENQGETHNVSHFISFDAPQKGANVPPGLIRLRRFASNVTFPLSLILEKINKCFEAIPAAYSLDSPAAKQLLLYNDYGIAPNSEYQSLQNSLNALGYPTQAGIKNIAMINGALEGFLQRKFRLENGIKIDDGELNPGDKIFYEQYIYVIVNVFLNAWSNVPNESTKVFEGTSVPLFPGYESTSMNISKSLDGLSGGRISYDSDLPLNFSFVPIFSAIDYKGTLNNNSDNSIRISDFFDPNNSNTIIDANFKVKSNKQFLTPFSAIYGNYANNSKHSQSDELIFAWNQLALREGYGITNTDAVLTNCSLPLPPVVMRTGTFFKIGRVNSILPSGVCRNAPVYKLNLPSTIDLIIPNGNQTTNYQQFIRITGGSLISPRILNVNGWNIATFNYSNLGNGTYTITTVRKFYGGNSQEVTNSTTMQISGSCRIASNYCPEDNEEGDEIGVLIDVNKSCYASKYNGVWVASLENGEFVSRSRLIANGMNVNSANCFAESDPSGGGYPACNCGFTLNSVSQNSGQASGNFVFNSCNASKIKWKIMNGSTELYSEEVVPQSATVPFNIPSTVNSGSYEFVIDGVWCIGTTNSLPFNYTKPNGGNTLSLNQSSWLPSSAANTQSINVTSNVGWSISSSDGSWLTASPTSGSNNGSFTINATTNSATSSRTGTITVSGSGVSSQTVSVSQAGTGGGGSICSNISTTNCGNASEGYIHTIDVPTAGDYKFKITYASGESNPTGSIIVDSDAAIQFSVGSSTGSWTPSSEVFVGTVQKTLSAGNHNIRIAGVNGVSGSNFAYNKLCIVSATGGGNTLSLSQGSWSPSSSSASQSINVASNISWSVSTDNPIWLTVSTSSGSGNGSFSINVTANGSTSSRSGTITVSGSGVASQIVSVTQAGTGGGGTTVCSNIGTVSCGNASEGHTHSLNITQAGNYKFKITYASGESNATGTITVDSDPATQFSVGPSTGSWTPSVEVLVGSVQKTLSVGNHTIRIAGVNGVSGSSFTHNKLCAVDASSNRIATAFEEVEESLTVYPNPTNSKIQVSFTLQKDENVWFNLYNTQGKNLQLSDYAGKAGRNVVEFDLQNYPAGAYFIDLQYNQKREIQKVIKVN